MELRTTFCDICNPAQLRRSDGRGYCDWPQAVAVNEIGWNVDSKGRHVCPECQENEEQPLCKG